MEIADTDVLIDYLGRKGAFVRVSEAIAKGRLAVAMITCYELMASATGEVSRRNVQGLIDQLVILPFDLSAAGEAAKLSRYLARMGSRIGTSDSLIAGTALATGLPVLTRNPKQFERIPGLKLVKLTEQIQ